MPTPSPSKTLTAIFIKQNKLLIRFLFIIDQLNYSIYNMNMFIEIVLNENDHIYDYFKC